MSIRSVLKRALDSALADMEKANADVDNAEAGTDQGAKDKARIAWGEADDDINSAYDALAEIDRIEGKPAEYGIQLSRAGNL